MGEDLLAVKNLHKYFPVKGGVIGRTVGWVKAVDGVSFSIRKGETFGLVGESGCGKTTLAKTILRLLQPTSGEVYYDGIDVTKLMGDGLRRLRRKMQMVFQDPYASLDPRQTVKSALVEPMKVHAIVKDSTKASQRAAELIRIVGLNEDHLYRFPHEFSGGQRQRIAVARALAVNPEFMILDEPTSFLDVSVQAQILNLLTDLQESFNLTYLFISHNLGVIKHMSDRVGVMYLGRIVEVAEKSVIYDTPNHPYTYALVSAIPVPNPEVRRERVVLGGDVPSAISIPSGCRFHPRCPYATEKCVREDPEFISVSTSHIAACHYALELQFEKPLPKPA